MTPEEQKLIDDLLAQGYSEDEIVAAFSEDEGGASGLPTSTPAFDEKVAERRANKSLLEGFGDVTTDLGEVTTRGMTFGLSDYAKSAGQAVSNFILGERSPEVEEALRIEEAAKLKAPEPVRVGAEVLGSILTGAAVEKVLATKAIPALVTKAPQLAKALTPFVRGGKTVETLPAQMLSGGGAGAIQAGISSLGEEDQTGDVLAGAMLGAGMPLAVKAGGGLFNFGRGIYRRAKPGFEEFIAEPVTQKYLGLAEKLGLLNNKASKITELDDTTRQTLEFLNRTIPDKEASKNFIKGILGVMEEKGPLNIKLNKQFDNNYETLSKLGIFKQGGTLTSLKGFVKDTIETWGKKKSDAIDAIDKAFEKINEGVKSAKDLKGLVLPKDLAPHLDGLRTRIQDLKLNELSEPIARKIKGTMNSIRRDIKPSVITKKGVEVTRVHTPLSLLKMHENLNAVRRTLLEEFNAGNIAKGVKGDTIGGVKDTIATIAEIQDSLMKVIEDKLDDPTLRKLSGVDKEIFKTYNKNYSALKVMEDVLETRKMGALNKGTITFAPPGQEPPGSIGMSLGATGPRFYTGEVMDRFLGSKEGMPKMLAALLASEGIENSPEAIKLLTALQKGRRMMIPPEIVGGYDFSKFAPPLTSGVISMMNREE